MRIVLSVPTTANYINNCKELPADRSRIMVELYSNKQCTKCCHFLIYGFPSTAPVSIQTHDDLLAVYEITKRKSDVQGTHIPSQQFSNMMLLAHKNVAVNRIDIIDENIKEVPSKNRGPTHSYDVLSIYCRGDYIRFILFNNLIKRFLPSKIVDCLYFL